MAAAGPVIINTKACNWLVQLGARAKCGKMYRDWLCDVARSPRRDRELAPQLGCQACPLTPSSSAASTTGNPVGTIDQILVKQIGDLLTKQRHSRNLLRAFAAGERYVRVVQRPDD